MRSAHREERWNWSKVATMASGYYPTVLSQELSQILSQTLLQFAYDFDRNAQKKKKKKKRWLRSWKGDDRLVALPC